MCGLMADEKPEKYNERLIQQIERELDGDTKNFQGEIKGMPLENKLWYYRQLDKHLEEELLEQDILIQRKFREMAELHAPMQEGITRKKSPAYLWNYLQIGKLETIIAYRMLQAHRV